MNHRIFCVGVVMALSVSLAAAARSVGAPEGSETIGPGDAVSWPGSSSSSADTMAVQYVSSVGVDSFHWYRNDPIGGDTFDISSMDTNTSAPFQIAVDVQGSWDFDVHIATGIFVYTAGSGSAAVAVGTLTLGDGYHVLYNDTSVGGTELHIDIPGPSASSAPPLGSPSSPSSAFSSNPLWDDIEAEFSHVEWKMVDGRLQYRFLGNNAASTLLADLHQPGGAGDIVVSYLGDATCSSLAMPAELIEDTVSVSPGHHDFEAGTSGSGPWTLAVSWGPAPCPADLNGDGSVNFHDLMEILTSWGGCP